MGDTHISSLGNQPPPRPPSEPTEEKSLTAQSKRISSVSPPTIPIKRRSIRPAEDTPEIGPKKLWLKKEPTYDVSKSVILSTGGRIDPSVSARSLPSAFKGTVEGQNMRQVLLQKPQERFTPDVIIHALHNTLVELHKDPMQNQEQIESTLQFAQSWVETLVSQNSNAFVSSKENQNTFALTHLIKFLEGTDPARKNTSIQKTLNVLTSSLPHEGVKGSATPTMKSTAQRAQDVYTRAKVSIAGVTKRTVLSAQTKLHTASRTLPQKLTTTKNKVVFEMRMKGEKIKSKVKTILSKNMLVKIGLKKPTSAQKAKQRATAPLQDIISNADFQSASNINTTFFLDPEDVLNNIFDLLTSPSDEKAIFAILNFIQEYVGWVNIKSFEDTHMAQLGKIAAKLNEKKVGFSQDLFDKANIAIKLLERPKPEPFTAEDFDWEETKFPTD